MSTEMQNLKMIRTRSRSWKHIVVCLFLFYWKILITEARVMPSPAIQFCQPVKKAKYSASCFCASPKIEFLICRILLFPSWIYRWRSEENTFLANWSQRAKLVWGRRWTRESGFPILDLGGCNMLNLCRRSRSICACKAAQYLITYVCIYVCVYMYTAENNTT